MKTGTPSVTAITPPLTTSTTIPSKISSVPAASSTRWKFFSASTFFFERIMVPSASLTLSTLRVMTSPTLTISAGFTLGSSESSSAETNPVCLLPTLTTISVSLTTITVASTLSPFLTYLDSSSLKDCSSISSKLFSSTLFSLMVCSTSLITPAGVDAPAVMPITLQHFQ